MRCGVVTVVKRIERVGGGQADACHKPRAHSIGITAQELDELAVRLRVQQDSAKLSGARTQAGRITTACGKTRGKCIDVVVGMLDLVGECCFEFVSNTKLRQWSVSIANVVESRHVDYPTLSTALDECDGWTLAGFLVVQLIGGLASVAIWEKLAKQLCTHRDVSGSTIS